MPWDRADHLWLFNEGSGGTVANSGTETNTGTLTTPDWVADATVTGDHYLDFVRANSDIVDFGNAATYSAPAAGITVWLQIRVTDIASIQRGLCKGITGAGATTTSGEWNMYVTGGTNMRFQVYTTDNLRVDADAVLPNGSWCLVAGKYAPGSGSIWLNGTVQETVTTTGNVKTGSGYPLWLGGDPFRLSNYGDFECAAAAIWLEPLTDAEMQQITTETPAAGGFFDVSVTGTNSPVNEGSSATVDYSVSNTGGSSDTQDITLTIEKDPELILIESAEGGTLNAGWTAGTASWATQTGSAADGTYAFYPTATNAALEAETTAFTEYPRPGGRFMCWQLNRSAASSYFEFGLERDATYTTYLTFDLNWTDSTMEIWADGVEVASAPLTGATGQWLDCVAYWADDGTVTYWIYDATGTLLNSVTYAYRATRSQTRWYLLSAASGTGVLVDNVRFESFHPYTGTHFTQM